jgi:hypothetical protein
MRFTNVGGPTERVGVLLGLGLYSRALTNGGGALQVSLEDRVQRWRVQPISESRPPISLFRVKPADGLCAKPVVSHRFLRPGGRSTRWRSSPPQSKRAPTN